MLQAFSRRDEEIGFAPRRLELDDPADPTEKIGLVVLPLETGELEMGVGIDQSRNQDCAGEVDRSPAGDNGGDATGIVEGDPGVGLNQAGAGVQPVRGKMPGADARREVQLRGPGFQTPEAEPWVNGLWMGQNSLGSVPGMKDST